MSVLNLQSKEKPYALSYKPHDRYVVINSGDRDLTPVVLELPDPPDLKHIDGYGMMFTDQYWKRLETPPRLAALEKQAMNLLAIDFKNNKREAPNGYKQQKLFWQLLEEKWEGYQEEISWIKRIQWYLTYGYWFFNDGKPTWITPWHFRYLQFWYMQDVKNHYPEYRDVDRRLEIFAWYNYTTTETFAKLDENGVAQPDENGVFHMKDIGYRTSFGIQNPKRRRRGDTQRGLNKLVWIMERRRGALCPIVADTGDHAEKIFKEKLIPALREEPVWLKPLWTGSYDTSSILCVPPGNIYFDDFLDSAITITDTSAERANDSRKLYGLLSDEEGKGAARADVGSRWEINKLTMAQDDIHGYSEHPSTVEDMCAGGSEYEAMWYQSNFYIRGKGNGQTKSGLSRIYIPSYDGLDGFIDRFGASVIEYPTERQMKLSPNAKFSRLAMGAREFLESDLQPLLMTGKASDMKLYREKIRKNPMKSADMWVGTSGDIGFDYQIIDKRIIELKRQPLAQRYDLFWENDIKDTKVLCRVNPKGDFVMPIDIERFIKSSNQWTYGATVWNERKQVFENQRMPLNGVMATAGADPFGMGSPAPGVKGLKKSQYSDGGIAVIENGTETDGDVKEWNFHNYLLYYQCRKNVFDYYEDVIKAIVFFNSLIAFERNREGLWNYMVDRGYGGYMKYQQKPDGTYELKPGFYAGAQNKENLFLEVINHIAMHGHKEKIVEFLLDCRQIKSMDEMTKFDGWTACGWAAMGAKSPYGTSSATVNNLKFDWNTLYEAPYHY